jgi:hypothetical protein
MTVVQDAEATGVGKRQRELWVDNLRVLVIAGVIIVHTATGYVVDIAGWYYDDERTTSQFWSTLVTIPAFFGAVFALGPLFVVAGWFSARSIARRGPGGFAWSRLLRLGVPVVVYVVAVQPLTDYLGNIRSEKGTFTQYLRTTEVSVMWFAAALLAFRSCTPCGSFGVPRHHRRNRFGCASASSRCCRLGSPPSPSGRCGRYTRTCTSTCESPRGHKALCSSRSVSTPLTAVGSLVCRGTCSG